MTLVRGGCQIVLYLLPPRPVCAGQEAVHQGGLFPLCPIRLRYLVSYITVT